MIRRARWILGAALLLNGAGAMAADQPTASSAEPAAVHIAAGESTDGEETKVRVQLCQAIAFRGMSGPSPRLTPRTPANCERCGGVVNGELNAVDSYRCRCGEQRWQHNQPMLFGPEMHGEYVGPARTPHVAEYRLRVDDQLEMIYRLTRERTSRPYELAVGDSIRLELLRDESITRDLIVQPDGSIVIPLIGRVIAGDRTIEELQRDITEKLKKYYNEPVVIVTPLVVNTRLEDLRSAVDRRAGSGGQALTVRITPAGNVHLPGIGTVPAHGLTLEELKLEVDARYNQTFGGIAVTPLLQQRAPRFIYVVGEVSGPGRFELQGPTTAMQAVAMAGGWNVGANLRQVVVFRRAEDWRLVATMLDLRGALYGKRPSPSDEIWLRDSDIVLVPKSPIRVADDAIELIFSRGLYSMFPFIANSNNGFDSFSTL